MTDLFSLAGRVALVTGSSRGIGLGIAEAMAKCGAHVVMNGRDVETLAGAATELTEASLDVSTAPFDASDPADVDAAVGKIVAERGRLDIAIGNAGTTINKPLKEFSPDNLHKQMAANLDSCFYLSRAVAPHMAANRFGRIILLASVMGVISRPNLAAYSASMSAVRGLVSALAVELGPSGISCNAIAPGYTKTGMHPKADDTDAWVGERIPLQRWGVPRDMGGAAVFLASAAGSYCSGHTLVVDGGLSVMA